MAPANPAFWDEVVISYQDEEFDFEFTNPVSVAEHFIRCIALGAENAGASETLQKKIARFEVVKRETERQLKKLERSVMAANFAKAPKSANGDIRAAFVRAELILQDREKEYEDLHDTIDDLEREIDRRTPKLKRLEKRARFLERSLEWATQYLNYDKLLERMENTKRSVR